MSRLRKILLLATLAALGGSAAGSRRARMASKGQWSVFEDHTALVKASCRSARSDAERGQGAGVDTIRVEVKWNEVAPDPSSKTKPKFDASDPAAYAAHAERLPGLLPLRRPDRARSALGLPDHHHDHRRRAALGDGGRQRHAAANANYRPSPGEYANFAAAVAKRYSGIYAGLPAVRYFTIWNEPNHRQFIKPTKSAPGIYRNLVDAAIPQIRRSEQEREDLHRRDRRRSAGAEGDGPEGVLPQVALPEQPLKRTSSAAGCRSFKKIDADGYAHHPYGPTARVPKTRDMINMLAIRQLGELPRQGGGRRPHPAQPADLQHRVRPPVATRPTGSSARPPCARPR